MPEWVFDTNQQKAGLHNHFLYPLDQQFEATKGMGSGLNYLEQKENEKTT